MPALDRRLLLGLLTFMAIPIATWAQQDSPTSEEEALQKASEQGTILITKEVTGPYRPQLHPDLQKVAALIVKQTNSFREDHDRSAVTVDETLQKTAQSFAEYMARTGRYGHHADEHTAQERAQAAGYEVCFIAENIAMQFKENGFTTGALTKAFVQGWKNSPGHRKNMLREEVTQTGVAVAQSSETGAFFAVQLFGRPRSQAIALEIANQTDSTIAYKLGDESFELSENLIRRHFLCADREFQLMQDGKTLKSIMPESGDRILIQMQNGSLTFEREPGVVSLPSASSADHGPK